MKKLNELVDCTYDIDIQGVESDSRKVKPGYLFVAIHGFNVDHHLYIEDAIRNGAVAIIGDQDFTLTDIIYIRVSDTNEALMNIISKFYDHVEKKFRFIGITGTDGKTTTALLVSKILDCGYIGTNGVEYRGHRWSVLNTTPEICEMYTHLEKLHQLGCKQIVMEVSSEALLHDRVNHLSYDIACFTNITEDHLNIHKTLKNYVDSKKKLFSFVKENGISILNRDDKNYLNVKKCCQGNVYSYGKSEDADFQICKISCQATGTTFQIKNHDQTFMIRSKLLLEYNVYNLTLAFIICYYSGITTQDILSRIEKVDSIEGRGERLDYGQRYTLILDYAHTYNGIYNLITNFKKIPHRKMIVVTGAAGGREKEKRSKIGKMLLENVDYVIFTMDDPRYESVDDIIDQLVADTSLTNYERIINREEAIFKALSMGQEDDFVLIIGKGRDHYMAIEDQKVDYCDYDVIESYFTNS